MDYEQFKKEWKESMVYRIKNDLLEQEINDYYTEYKTDPYFQKQTVKEWCDTFFMDFDLDTHDYMPKSKAIKSKHAQGLINLIGDNKPS